MPALYTAGKYLVLAACGYALFKLISRIYQYVVRYFSSQAKSVEAPQPKNMAKMIRNLKKAFEDHRLKPDFPLFFERLVPLTFEHHIITFSGSSGKIEDEAFCNSKFDGFVLAGVFDGYGDDGHDAAKIAAGVFKGKAELGNVFNLSDMHTCFREMFGSVDKIVKAVPNSGTTACLVCVDKLNNNVYTATLGTPEAGVFRKSGEKITFFPLSPIRNWGHKTETARAEGACPGIIQLWGDKLAHERYFPADDNNAAVALNVSRALGNVPISDVEIDELFDESDISSVRQDSAILHKPKVSVFPLEPGDLLVVATKGFWKGLNLETIESQLKDIWGDVKRVSSVLGSNGQGTENLAIVAIQAQAVAS